MEPMLVPSTTSVGTPHAGAQHDIGRHPLALEHLQHPEVGDPLGAAAAEDEGDPRVALGHAGGLRANRRNGAGEGGDQQGPENERPDSHGEHCSTLRRLH
jgi:hypothetical protein